jgi:hypothetical protein
MNIDISELPTMIAQLLDNGLEAAVNGLEAAVNSLEAAVNGLEAVIHILPQLLEAAIHILPQLLEAMVGVLTHGSHLIEERHKLLSGRKCLQHYPPQFVTHFGMLPQQRGQISPELLYELCLRHISRYP